MYSTAALEAIKILEQNSLEISKAWKKLDDDDRDFILQEIAERMEIIVESGGDFIGDEDE